nr:hypothetical protein [Tanacetum cinerariifolium]
SPLESVRELMMVLGGNAKSSFGLKAARLPLGEFSMDPVAVDPGR